MQTRVSFPRRSCWRAACVPERFESAAGPHQPRGFAARHPLPKWERVLEYAARSSLHLPDRGAVLLVFELNAHSLELIANAIGFLEVLCLARISPGVDQLIDFFRVNCRSYSSCGP